MTQRRFPTRVVEVERHVRGPSGQGTGWIRSLDETVSSLAKKVFGVKSRMNQNLGHGRPSCVSGEKVFIADRRIIRTIANFATSPDATPPVFVANLTVNPIILAGETYKISVRNPPPGILDAHHLVVGVEAGFLTFNNSTKVGITPLNDYRQLAGNTATGQIEGGFTSSSPAAVGGAVIRWTNQMQVLGDWQGAGRIAETPFLPFLWNIIDENSGRQYASDWMPHGALLNPRGEAVEGANVGTGFGTAQTHRDGEIFEFDRAWRIERDADLTFLFRPLMDLYQVDSDSATLPYAGVDDRSGGIREERAIVRVEFHGTRKYDEQDVLKYGAQV